MARSLLILLSGACGWGCLVSNPPDYDIMDEHAPVVVVSDPSSLMVVVDKDDQEKTSTSFFAKVLDQNLDDFLEHRWFLDFRPNETDLAVRCGLVHESYIRPTGEEIRELVYPLAHNLLRSGACHRLSLAITDGKWSDGSGRGCAEVAEGDQRVMVDWWLVTYDQTNTLPSVEGCLALAKRIP